MDLALLRDDIRRGDTTRYAIDFAEIMAYVVPDRAHGFWMFSDDSDAINAELERAALQQVFFGPSHSLVVLPPYALELQSFEEELNAAAAADFAAAAASALAELTELATDADFANLTRVVMDGQRDEASIARAVDFLEHRATGMLALLDQTYIHPLQRLKSLLRSGRLTTLSLLLGFPVEPHARIQDNWFAELRQARAQRKRAAPESSSRLDAIAVAVIDAVNASDHDFSLALITRSEYMHDVSAKLGMEHYLRHPRTFIAFAGVAEALSTGGEGEDSRTELDSTDRALARMLDSLDAFLDVARGVRAQDLSEEAIAAVTERLRRIKSEWHSAAKLRGAVARSQVRGDRRDDAERISEVFALLVGNADLRDAVRARLADLSREVAENHQMLGVLLERQLPPAEVSYLDAHSDMSSISLPATKTTMPYDLQFFSEGVLTWSNRFERDRRILWTDLHDFVAASIDRGADYETLLAVAYMFGVLNRWDVAERYCQLSLEYAKETAFPHEGKFLLAICMRKKNAGFERLLNAFDLIDEAIRLKKLRLQNSEYEDPRYLKELAYLIFVLNHKPRDERDGSGETWPSIETAIGLSEQVLALPESTPYLKAQACNNILYYYLEDAFERPEAGEIIDRYYGLLVRIVDDIGTEWVSPGIRHTLILARWRVPQLRGSTTLEDLASELLVLCGMRELTPEEQREIRRHVADIRRSMNS